MIAGWIEAALNAFATWVKGSPVSDLGSMGPLSQLIVDPRGTFYPDGPERLLRLLSDTLTLGAVPNLPTANPPSVIIGRGRLIFGIDGFPISVPKAIAVIPPADDSDKTPVNQLRSLLRATAEQMADRLSKAVSTELWDAARDPSLHWVAPAVTWTHWRAAPKPAPLDREPPGTIDAKKLPSWRSWPDDEAVHARFIARAQEPCGCGFRIHLRNRSAAGYSQVGVAAPIIDVDEDAFFATVHTMVANLGLEYLRLGISNGAGLAQRAHHRLDAGRRDVRGLAPAIAAQADLFERQEAWAKRGLLYLPVPPPAESAVAAQNVTRNVVAAQLQLQMFRVIGARKHLLHQELTALNSLNALLSTARLPSGSARDTAPPRPLEGSPLDGLRNIAAACRTVSDQDRLRLVRQWLKTAQSWRPARSSDVVELAVMVEQLDWDLVSFGQEVEARDLREQVWNTLNAAMPVVRDDDVGIVNVLRSHRHRGSAVIATKRGQHDSALIHGRKGITELRAVWLRSSRYTPSALAIDVMQQSVLAYAGHWVKLAEESLCAAARRQKRQEQMPLAIVLRAALLWGWQALVWLDAVIGVDTQLPTARWSQSERLAVPSWQIQPRSIAIRAMVAAILATHAGLVTSQDLEKARDTLVAHGLEPPDINSLPGSVEPGGLVEMKSLLSSNAPRQILQSMLQCPAVTRAHRGIILQSALLVRSVLGDGEDMPALIDPGENGDSHPVLGDLTVLWRSPSLAPFRPTLTAYAEALERNSQYLWMKIF